MNFSALTRLKALYARHRSVRLGVEFIGFLAIVTAVGAWQTRHHATGSAPAFALEQLDSHQLVSNATLRGKPALVVFWAPWCSVCRMEEQNIAWVRTLSGDRARVVSIVASYESTAQVQRHVEQRQLSYPVLLGNDGLTRDFAIEAFPTAYFLDDQGRITHSVSGYTTTLGLLWRLWSS